MTDFTVIIPARYGASRLPGKCLLDLGGKPVIQHVIARALESEAGRVVVATAGTTDLPVAEEAAVVLEASNCDVDRINDVGVAGLHRIINAFKKFLKASKVKCILN